jgi:Flp pilus assembly protein TadG
VVEFAVLIPVVLVLLLGILEMGRLMEVQQTLTCAARAGARQAARLSAEEDAAATVIEAYLGQCGVTDCEIDVAAPPGQPYLVSFTL